jgi:hypothetical protein
VKQKPYLLEQMKRVLEQVEFYTGLTLGLRSRLVETEDTVGITKSKSKPTERQLAKVWEKMACEAKSCILTRLTTFHSTVTKDLLKVGQCRMFALEIQNLAIGLVWASSDFSSDRVKSILKGLEESSLVHTSSVGINARQLATACSHVLEKM